MVTFLFIQKLVEDFRRRRPCTNQRQNGSRQAVSDFCVHGYLSGFIDFKSLDMLSLQASGGVFREPVIIPGSFPL
ncbi:hypothetical protein DXX75_026940 [Escherichia coli]|nr:hypothetical protein DXX75_026940 [Escherichia coli]